MFQVCLHKYDETDLLAKESQSSVLNKVRKLQIKDKGVYDKAMRAFVSYYRAYSKYECSYILRTKGEILITVLNMTFMWIDGFLKIYLFVSFSSDLDLGPIAETFGLLKFPKMSELWGKVPDNFHEADVDINSLPYK